MPVNQSIEQQLAKHLDALLSAEQRGWLDDAIATLVADRDPVDALLRYFPSARRRLGRLPAAADATIQVDDRELPLAGWEANDLGRAAMLVALCARQPATEFVPILFRAGDETERITIVRSLALLPDAELLKPVALEAGRGNSAALCAALVLDNSYPARLYTEHEFNQMVLKALFMGLPIGRILGLERRANPELARMCEDFFDERTAANRMAPLDIWLAMVPHASPRGLELAKTYLGSVEPGHRFHAALALGRRASQDPELRALLKLRRETETDERVLSALKLVT